MAETSIVTSNLVQKYWETKLDKVNEGEDIFSGYRAMIKTDSKLPNGIIVVSKQTGQTTRTVGLVKPLKGSGKTGRTALSGSEEKLEILDYQAFANEFKHGIEVPRFGIDAVANTPYKIYEMAAPFLTEYVEKMRGLHTREALCQRFSSNTTVAPSSTTQHINSNVFVAGVALASQPAYSDTLATYKAAINTAIPNTPLAANQMTPAVVKMVEYWAFNVKKITPMDDGFLIMTVPPRQKMILMDETTGLLKHFSTSSMPEKALKGWIGSYGKIHFVEDLRAPAIIADDSGTSITWTYTSVADSRPAAGADTWDVGFVLGKGAILELELEKTHYEKDLTTEYGRDLRLGVFCNYGMQTIEYANGTDARINQGSAVVFYASQV